jgi:hypothetical protein
MSATLIKNDSMFYNPLDVVETVIMDRDWMFDRPDDNELVADAAGQWCKYNIWFAWQEDCRGLTLSCTFDSKFPKRMLPQIHTLLGIANEKLWLGHYEVNSEEMSIAFRYSLMVKDDGIEPEQLREVLDLAIEECERLYPAYQSVVWGGKPPEEAVAIAMFDTVAEA